METFLITISILFALKEVASIVVSMTDTPKDDEALAGFYKILEVVAGIYTNKAKQP